jgi:hypothetical protein
MKKFSSLYQDLQEPNRFKNRLKIFPFETLINKENWNAKGICAKEPAILKIKHRKEN